MVMLDCPGEDAGAPDVVDDLVDARGDLVGPDQRTEESMPCSLEVVLSVEAFTDVCWYYVHWRLYANIPAYKDSGLVYNIDCLLTGTQATDRKQSEIDIPVRIYSIYT